MIEAQTKMDVVDIEAGLTEYRNGNLEAIAEKAVPLLENVSKPKIDPAWGIKWYENARNTSDEEVQLWWARILAGEARSQGSFSKWALDAVARMSKDDIEAFTRLASCVWRFGPGLNGVEVVYWKSSRKIIPLSEHALQRTGLVTGFGSPLEGVVKVRSRQAYLHYFNERYPMTFPESLEVSRGTDVALTLLGKELHSLCDATPNDDYKTDCIRQWKSKGIVPLDGSNLQIPDATQGQVDEALMQVAVGHVLWE